MSSHPCRLVKPCKSELGKITKAILKKINNVIVKSLSLNQWKDTNQIISWFRNIKDKGKCVFIQLDILPSSTLPLSKNN